MAKTVTDLTKAIGVGEEPVATYPYRPRAYLVYAGVPLSIAAAIFSGFEAAKHEPLHLWRLHITLTPHAATVIGWSVSAVFTAMAVVAAAVSIRATVKRYALVLTPSSLAVPPVALFGNRATVIPLLDIHRLRIRSAGRNRWLQIEHRKGKINIMESYLPDDSAFDDISRKVSTLTGSALES